MVKKTKTILILIGTLLKKKYNYGRTKGKFGEWALYCCP